jgi:hypothetical protein
MNITDVSSLQKKQLVTPVVTLQKSGTLYINCAAVESMGMRAARYATVDIDEKNKFIKLRLQGDMIGDRILTILRTRPGPLAGFKVNIQRPMRKIGAKLNFSHVMAYDFDGETLTLDMKHFVK